MKIGDKVKVIGQDITGTVLRTYHTNEIVIRDNDSEYESPDDELIYKPYELELLEVKDYEIEEWLGSDTGDANEMLRNAIEALVGIANGKYTAKELRKDVIELQERLDGKIY